MGLSWESCHSVAVAQIIRFDTYPWVIARSGALGAADTVNGGWAYLMIGTKDVRASGVTSGSVGVTPETALTSKDALVVQDGVLGELAEVMTASEEETRRGTTEQSARDSWRR